MANTVTIGKAYFEALLRRAEFYTSGDEYSPQNFDPTSVTLSKAEHERLLQVVREYNILRRALFRGGLTLDTLNLLISGEGDEANFESKAYNVVEETFTKPSPAPVPIRVSLLQEHTVDRDAFASTVTQEGILRKPYTHLERGNSFGIAGSSIESPLERTGLFSPDNGEYFQQRTPLARNDKRTLLFTNLSDRATHKDLVSMIRGGRLLDIFVRNDRSATVSFVEGAQEFLSFTKRNDFYIHAKRVEVRWNDRQFHLPSHVAHKIAGGATRNLLVRDGARRLTEEGIRDDLEHIHNLVVIEVRFENGDAYISTNSIHNALFARTCMMSRTKYKGLRIEWYEDECANPIPKSQLPSHAATPQPKKSVLAPIVNRYAVLNTDGTEDGSGDEAEPINGYSSYGVGLSNWAADTSIAT